ncbi:MAG: hypothetical protein PHQ40_20205 [Anaerolineaceae bacterium]|nr:hypothetical protein [Anaerolineaceae bacterium]
MHSGLLDLNVSGGPLDRTDLKPGLNFTELGAICTKNNGSIDLKFRGLFETDQKPESDLLTFVTLRVELKINGVWSIINEISGKPSIETDGLPYYFKYPDQDPRIINLYVISSNLAPSQETCYRFSAKLDLAAPESVLDKLIPFNLHFFATQTTNPGWD